MNLCMDPCLVAELIHVLFPMHICYTKPNPLCLLWDCVRVQPGHCRFCAGVCSVLLVLSVISVCERFSSAAASPGFLLFPWVSSFFQADLLKSQLLWTFIDGSAEPAHNTLICDKREDWKWGKQNIYVDFFSLILWSWLNWSKRVTLFQGGIIDETAISDGAVFWCWNGAWNDKITCWVILGNVQIPGSWGMFCLSHEQYLSWQWTWEETEEARTSLQWLGVTSECLKVTQRILGRGISKSRFDIKKCDQSHLQGSLFCLLNG